MGGKRKTVYYGEKAFGTLQGKRYWKGGGSAKCAFNFKRVGDVPETKSFADERKVTEITILSKKYE